MNKRAWAGLAWLVCALAFAWCDPAQAKTATVGATSGSDNYATIQDALDSYTQYDTIVVYPGSYEENILIDSAPVSAAEFVIAAYEGPYLTSIDGKQHTDSRQPTITIKENLACKVQIRGFYITNGTSGIQVGENTPVKIVNCVFQANDVSGVQINGQYSPSSLAVEVYNNVFIQNGQSGLFLNTQTDYRGPRLFYAYIKNNLFLQNVKYGIQINGTPSSSTTNGDRVQISYNGYASNGAQYSWTPTVCVIPGTGEVAGITPGFVGNTSGCGLDVRLLSASACHDLGSPSSEFSDPDGSRNDLGAYGGPYAESFYEGATDGPVVRSMSVTPGVVVRGQSLTIEATTAAR